MDETKGELRRLPAQDRSAQRIDLILDTAAVLLDEVGYGELSPTAIARRAGMSHAAIYRYFADTGSVVRALATRNLDRFLAATARVLEDPGIGWRDALGASIDCYIGLFRTEPGFRVLRFGDGVDLHLLSETETNKQLIAALLVDYFRARFDLWYRPDFLRRVEVMLELIDAIVSRAFLVDPRGDPFFLREAKHVALGYMEETLAADPGSPTEADGGVAP